MKPWIIAVAAAAIGAGATGLANAADDSAREQRIERQKKTLELKAQRSVQPLQPLKLGSFRNEGNLGRQLFRDPNLSLNRNQSCASCHSLAPARDPETGERLQARGFVDNQNVRTGDPVSDGSVKSRFGALNAPSVGYAAFSPAFHWDAVEGLYVGGQFWNGRANDLAEQARQPFLNPAEMAMPSKWAVVSRVREKPVYVRAFRKFYDFDLMQIPPNDSAPASAQAPLGVNEAFQLISEAIAKFEQRRAFNQFTSKFDFVLAGRTSFTRREAFGQELFNGKAQCSACHVTDAGIAPDGSVSPPLFTDFTYDNIGAPRNLKIPNNPAPDPGLGGRPDVAERDPSGGDIGKHKVMSLRNIAITPPYGHNGVFESLLQITHFYNTRDTLGRVSDNLSPGFGVTGWPAPEIAQNVNVDELGDLGLTENEERALVEFMKTLTDGYPEWGNDPKVPPGTPSPFAHTPLPPFAR
ncbi:MAG: hypothetical protein KDD85_08530 [Parvularculaceae bacterium]|nr:hypothetical protein [Parvularculaceae bacterium]